jgi:hypothetical protein
MFTATPADRLQSVAVGSRVRLVGCDGVFIAKEIREDRYYSLWHGGKEALIASPCHRIEVKR